MWHVVKCFVVHTFCDSDDIQHVSTFTYHSQRQHFSVVCSWIKLGPPSCCHFKINLQKFNDGIETFYALWIFDYEYIIFHFMSYTYHGIQPTDIDDLEFWLQKVRGPNTCCGVVEAADEELFVGSIEVDVGRFVDAHDHRRHGILGCVVQVNSPQFRVSQDEKHLIDHCQVVEKLIIIFFIKL